LIRAVGLRKTVPFFLAKANNDLSPPVVLALLGRGLVIFLFGMTIDM